jgi:hypothetical protein
MIVPGVVARMKQRNRRSRIGIDGLDKVFVLGILGGRERSLIRLAAQLFDSRLQIRICAKVNKSRSRFRRQRFG